MLMIELLAGTKLSFDDLPLSVGTPLPGTLDSRNIQVLLCLSVPPLP